MVEKSFKMVTATGTTRTSIYRSARCIIYAILLLTISSSQGFSWHRPVSIVLGAHANRRRCTALLRVPVLRSTQGDDATGTDVRAAATQPPTNPEVNSLTKEEKVDRIKQKGYGFEGENVCIYKRCDGQWKRRKNITELRTGQRLFATKLDQDLLNGKTGAKIYFECGVGRIDKNGKWHMINGMMRLGGRETKRTVVQKRLKRFQRGALVEVYVSRINLEETRLEVVGSYDEAISAEEKRIKKVSVASLQPGQELVGTIVRVEPYGAIIDVGATQLGLLHINRVGTLLGKFVNKEAGLKEAGIVRKANVRVSVLSSGFKNTNDKWMRRLELDFTQDVKEAMEKERKERNEERIAERRARWESKRGTVSSTAPVAAKRGTVSSTAPVAANTDAHQYSPEHEDEEYGDHDEDDEDRAIEDALGLGFY